jgi:ribosome-associated protein
MLKVNRRIQIPLDEFELTFARSSGPGGQNVNKVNSKVTLHWPVETSPNLPDDVRQRFLARYRSRISKEGLLVIHSQRYRDQAKNVNDCLDKLRAWILEVATPPKRRIPTRPSRASKERRLREKKSRGQAKKLRGRPRLDD